MRTFNITGIVDVNMYNTLLDPAVTLDDEFDELSEAERDALWDRFDVTAYTANVRKLAVCELRKLLTRLPAPLRCAYVEDSAFIDSPKYYNDRGDELRFQLSADTDMSEAAFQAYLDDFFREDWSAEFGPDYHIYAYIKENLTIYSFLKEAEQCENLPSPSAKR